MGVGFILQVLKSKKEESTQSVSADYPHSRVLILNLPGTFCTKLR